MELHLHPTACNRVVVVPAHTCWPVPVPVPPQVVRALLHAHHLPETKCNMLDRAACGDSCARVYACMMYACMHACAQPALRTCADPVHLPRPPLPSPAQLAAGRQVRPTATSRLPSSPPLSRSSSHHHASTSHLPVLALVLARHLVVPRHGPRLVHGLNGLTPPLAVCMWRGGGGGEGGKRVVRQGPVVRRREGRAGAWAGGWGGGEACARAAPARCISSNRAVRCPWRGGAGHGRGAAPP